MTQEPSDAVSARSVLPLAARVIMVHVDKLTLLERLVAHRAGVILRRQNQVKLFLSESIARNPYFRLDFLRDSFDWGCGWVREYSRWRFMPSDVLQGPPWPGVRAHIVRK
jgi:hypothetical protein